MSAEKPQYLTPLNSTSDQPLVSSGDQSPVTSAEFGTTWRTPQSESESIAAGSISPTMTTPSLVANFLSGQLAISWSYFAKIFMVLIIVVGILFTLLVFYRDNELGRLQDMVGIQQSAVKAVSILVYASALVLITALVLWVGKKVMGKQKS